LIPWTAAKSRLEDVPENDLPGEAMKLLWNRTNIASCLF
jgi:hypothetical protein